MHIIIDSKKHLKDVEEALIGQRTTINRYMKCRKRRVSARQLEKKQLTVVQPDNEKGAFAPLPIEVLQIFYIIAIIYTKCFL